MEEDKLLEDKFLEFEVNNNLFDIEVSGIKIWDFVRFELLEEIKEKSYESKYTLVNSKRNKLKTILKILKQILGFITSPNRYIFNKQTDVVFIGHCRKILADGYYQDIYLNDVLNKITEKNINHLYLEYPVDFKHLTPNRTKNRKYLDYLDTGYGLSNFFIRYKLNLLEAKKINKLKQLIYDNFNVSIDVETLLLKITKQYKFLYPRILKIINKTKPKCLVVIDAYSLPNKIFLLIANQKNIPTIELQHGAIGTDHIAYRYPSDIGINSFPNYFFVWGKSWVENISIPKGSEYKCVGFPYLDEKNRNYNSNIEIKSNNILVISQWTIGLELMNWVNELARKNPSYNFMFKLHPLEYDAINEYKKNKKSDNIKIYKDEIDTYDFFKKCKIQIGVHSTLLFEGAAFNLITLVLPLRGSESTEKIPNTGFIFIKNREQLSKLDIKELNFTKSNNQLWEKNSVNKVVNEMENIINSYEV